MLDDSIGASVLHLFGAGSAIIEPPHDPPQPDIVTVAGMETTSFLIKGLTLRGAAGASASLRIVVAVIRSC